MRGRHEATVQYVLRKLRKSMPDIGLINASEYKGWLILEFNNIENAIRYAHHFDEPWFALEYENWHEIIVNGVSIAQYSI